LIVLHNACSAHIGFADAQLRKQAVSLNTPVATLSANTEVVIVAQSQNHEWYQIYYRSDQQMLDLYWVPALSVVVDPNCQVPELNTP
jgi:hypothetical protein